MKWARSAVGFCPRSISWSAFAAYLEPLFVLLVPFRDASVKIPAFEVETSRVGDLPHLVEGLAFELTEADRHVRYLDTRVVDVVLDFDRAPQEAKQPAERVTERGIPKMPDMGGLVRVDRRVLDDGLAAGIGRGRLVDGQPARERGLAVDEQVHVAVRRRFHPIDALDRPERAGDLLRDGAWSLAKPARKLEREWHGEIAERATGRHLDRDRSERRVVRRNAVQAADRFDEAAADRVLNR